MKKTLTAGLVAALAWQAGAVSVSGLSDTGRVTVGAGLVVYEHEKGETGRFSVRYDFPEWEPETWVFLPACAYNGNRDARLAFCPKYPPTCSVAGRGTEPVPERTQFPALNPDGSGEIEVTAGDMAVPCAGFFFPRAKRGLLVFTEQEIGGKNLGFSVKSGQLRIDYPANRKQGYRFCTTPAERPDAPMVLDAGRRLTSRVRRLEFAADSVSAFLETFFRNRKCLLDGERMPNGYSAELWRTTERAWNAFCWTNGAYCQEPHKWTPGWTGGPSSVYPLYRLGGETTKARCRATLDFLVRHQAPSGYYYGHVVKAGVCPDEPQCGPTDDPSHHLVRRSMEALYFLIRCGRTMGWKEEWKASARRCADALVRTWRSEGQFGQWIDIHTGKVIVGRTTSGAIVSAALLEAWKLFGNSDYREVAIAACEDYCRRDLDRGVTCGGPGEILMAPDSESAFGLLESCVALAEETRDPKWIGRARRAAALASTWVVSYRYRFPSGSTFGKLGINTVGAVWANLQNKHAAPGVCTLSGDSLLRLYRLTGDRAYLELCKDIAFFLPQTVSRDDRPIADWRGRKMPPGFVNERVNMSDWEGERRVGEIFHGFCWSGTALLLTWADLIGQPEFVESTTNRCLTVFVGTEGMGNVTPAATVPFGMVQAGPDTSRLADRYEFGKAHCGGYQHSDGHLWRFSQTHVSGMGVPAGGNVAILPLVDGETGESVEMDKPSETGEPGYYAVTLRNGIRCEVTASARTAVYRFAYPKGKGAELLFDVDWALMEPMADGEGVFNRTIRAGVCRFDSPHSLRGYQNLRCYVDYTVNFVADFSAPIVSRRQVRESDGRRGDVWRLGFGLLPEGVLEVRLALSFSSQDAAKRNLAAERAPFEAIRTAAAEKWRDWFDRLRIDGPEDSAVAANLRASMYHLAVQPNLRSDVGEPDRYMNFSLWDTFRAAHPLYTILAPERVDGFVNSLLDEYDSRGYLPILSLFGRDTHCMVGHHAAPVIADAYLKGFRGFDARRALAAMNRSYRVDHVPESTACWGFMKEDWNLLDRYGYYPFDLLRTDFRGKLLRGESVSRTLECAYDDSCVARLASALGEASDAEFFARRAGFWRNVFDPSVGFVRGKDSKGRWREPFDPATIGFGPFADRDFTEGNSYQYSWHVMQDPAGLVAALGGKRAAGEKLDRLFSTEAGKGKDDRSYDVTGLIGQYAHGNEVSHHIAYFYAYTDRPWRTAEVVDKVFETQYAPRPDGLCGNDDCGQMSAWYVFSALGFYPLDPCGGNYVLGAPRVSHATIRLQGGATLSVVANGLSKDRRHVVSAKLRTPMGERSLSSGLSHAELTAGGKLEFDMGTGTDARSCGNLRE